VGQEIAETQFEQQDFTRFGADLERETALLGQWLAAGRCDSSPLVVGFELEAWLLDHDALPYPANEDYLARLANPLVVPELSKFNVELNCTPQPIGPGAFRKLEDELTATWQHCLSVAHEMDGTLLAIGTLPTIRARDLTLANISPLNRFYALNDQVLKARGGRALRIRIDGREQLALEHNDVMLEAAATSFQVHLQAPAHRIARYHNASAILSAPLVAISANSPFLFGRDLWDETRIPLFEQAVDVGETGQNHLHRVTFGSGYVRSTPLEIFEENLRVFPVLLPTKFREGPERMDHLRLHNGTIWRWNRLLLGFDERIEPHLRIENRVMAAGPTIVDMIANAALYVGAAHSLAERPRLPETDLDFGVAHENFYRAARHGLAAELTWFGGRSIDARTVVLEEIVPMAADGLARLGFDAPERARYLDIVTQRARTGQNGAHWQRSHAARHGRDLLKLVADYLERQRSALPVHEWEAPC
jgi:hypothetical protein